MSYNSNTKTITAPVSIYDVQQALDTTEKDLGKLCRHENINMWAKYKPVRVATPLPIDDAARKVVRWGITPDYLPTGQEYFNKLIASKAEYLTVPNPTLGKEQLKNLQPYTYSFPRGDRTDNGGVKEWYRLSDFAGYKHDAVVPFRTCLQNVSKINNDENNPNWLLINPLRTHNISFVAYKDVNSEFNLEEILRVENLSSYFMVVEFYNGKEDAWKTAESPNYYYEFPLIASGSGQYFSGAVGTVDVTGMSGFYHVCIGLRQKDLASNTWVDKSGILSPREWDDNTFRGLFPYYYRLNFDSSQAEEEFSPISELGFGAKGKFEQGESATIWKTIETITNQQIFIKITMKNDSDKTLYFAGNNTSVAGTKMMLGIQNTTSGMDSGEIIPLIPSNEQRQSGGSLSSVTIPANSDENVLYATGYTLPNKQSSNTEYYKLQLYCKIGSSDWYPITAINLEYI